MGASEPKWVNPVLDIIGVNSLMLEDLQIEGEYIDIAWGYDNICI